MNAQLLVLKGLISDMPEESQTKIKETADKIRILVKENGEEGSVAMAYVGLEMQDEGIL